MHILTGFFLFFLGFGIIASVVGGVPSFAGGASISSPDDTVIQSPLALYEVGGDLREVSVHASGVNTIFDIAVSLYNRRLILAGSDRGLLISRDGGSTWRTFSDLDGNFDDRTAVYSILFSPHDSSCVYVSAFRAGAGGVYSLCDNFFNVRSLFALRGEAVYSMALSDGVLYLGLSDGRFISYTLASETFRVVRVFGSPLRLFAPRDRGVWHALLGSRSLVRFSRESSDIISLSGDTTPRNLSSFFFDPRRSSLLYLASREGLFRSSDGGTTWRALTAIPTASRAVYSVFVDSFGTLYAGTDRLYVSRDSGARWRIIDGIFTGKVISTMVQNGDTIILGTRIAPSFFEGFSLSL